MNQPTVGITTRKRVKGGWGKFEHRQASVEEVGKLLRRKYDLKEIGPNLFEATPIGEELMINFSGTLTMIGECYAAAGEELFKKYCLGEL